MMKLSMICTVDSIVNAYGGSPITEQILKKWDHEQGSARFFRSSANFVYRFRKEGKPCFLRFAASSERTRATIEAEIEILQWVAKRGITVTTPLASRNGNFVETVLTDLGTFHAVVFAGLEGFQLDIEDLDDSQFEEWGTALGKLHSVLANYAGSVLSARSTWRDCLEFVRVSLSKEILAVQSEFEQIASSLQALPITDDTYGLIHFDFELDNLYWQSQTIGIDDFDECSSAVRLVRSMDLPPRVGDPDRHPETSEDGSCRWREPDHNRYPLLPQPPSHLPPPDRYIYLIKVCLCSDCVATPF